MAAKEPNNSLFAGPGFTLQYIGTHVYAYSGAIGVTDSVTTMFEATSGSGYIVGKMQINYITSTENTIDYLIYLNNDVVQGYPVKGGAIYTEPDNPIYLVIPPFTTLKVTGENKSASTSRDHAVTIVGRVYRTE